MAKNGNGKNGNGKNGNGGRNGESAVRPFGMQRLRDLDQEAFRVADKKAYEDQRETMQETLLAVQQPSFHQQRRGIIVI